MCALYLMLAYKPVPNCHYTETMDLYYRHELVLPPHFMSMFIQPNQHQIIWKLKQNVFLTLAVIGNTHETTQRDQY